MKLHLGCGENYQKEFINIDISRDSVADKVLDMSRLPYKDNSIEKIESYHAIEHLSLIEAQIALSEWYRVLKDKGVLLLECPDFEKCLKEFLKATNKRKWQWWIKTIYGFQQPDSEELHKTGFNFKRMKSLLESFGFSEVKRVSPYFSHLTPNLRITCTKYKNDNFQLLARVRKKLRDDFEEPYLNSFDYINFWLRDWVHCLRKNKLNEIFFEGALRFPEITILFLEEVKKTFRNNRSEKLKEINKKLFLLKKLKKENFIEALKQTNYYFPKNRYSLSQNEFWQQLFWVSRTYLAGLIKKREIKGEMIDSKIGRDLWPFLQKQLELARVKKKKKSTILIPELSNINARCMAKKGLAYITKEEKRKGLLLIKKATRLNSDLDQVYNLKKLENV